jgi:hypothetical protein
VSFTLSVWIVSQSLIAMSVLVPGYSLSVNCYSRCGI